MKSYLPSKQFMIRIGIIASIVLVFFGGSKLIKFIQNKNGTAKEPKKIEVKNLVQKDTNKNGIPDWEEALWGLNPNKDGEENKAFILEKRKSLALENTNDEEYLTEVNPSNDTDNLAKEFFAVLLSLEQTGNLDDASMQEVANAVSGEITVEPIPDKYTSGMLDIKTANETTINNYYNTLSNLFTKYENDYIGSELTFIIQGLKNNDNQAVSLVKDIAISYESFGKELMKIPTPESLVDIHVSLANDYDKIAQSIKDLAQVIDEPIIGMKGLISYKKYSDMLISDIDRMSDNLE